MPAKNIYHQAVVKALTADGWTITHDPLTVSFGGKDFFVDLGAERVTVAAEKAGRKIGVEISSFLSPHLCATCKKLSGSTGYLAPSSR